MHLLAADLTKRNNDASRKTVIILTAALGSILVLGAFVMIYLLYQQITRNKEQKGNRIARREHPQTTGQPVWYGKPDPRQSYQNQSDFRGGRGIPFSKQGGCGALPKPAHQHQPKCAPGSRGRDMTPNRKEVYDKSAPMQGGGVARRAYPASTSRTNPSNFQCLGDVTQDAEVSEDYGGERERAKTRSPNRHTRQDTSPTEPLHISTANSLATSLDSGWRALDPPVKGRPRSSYRRPTELVDIATEKTYLAPPTLKRHSLPQPGMGREESLAHDGNLDNGNSLSAQQVATRHSEVNTGSESMFGSVDPVATAQAKKELRRGSWEMGFNTPQWPKPPVSSLKSLKSHPGRNGEENGVGSASEIDSLSPKPCCNPQQSKGGRE